MSTYFEFKGQLTFPSADVAKKVFQLLTDSTESLFWKPSAKQLKADQREIVFDVTGFTGAEPFYSTRSLVIQAAEKAVAGRVRSQCGDGDDGTEVDFYGFRPRPAAKKPAAKKAPAKKIGDKK